jgi:magnesium transporter
VGLGCAGADRIFIGLCDEIIGRIADLLEGAGRELDQVARAIFKPDGHGPAADFLQHALEVSGRQSVLVGNCRLSLLTLDRALSFFRIGSEERGQLAPLRSTIEGLSQDIKSLEVHGDYLSSRVTQVMDATLGMINLAQNRTVRIVSVVAALFLPPTLVASIYGMNFRLMPELTWPLGYPLAMGLMVLSAIVTYLVFRWKKWL